jgi:tetratricopeptide (TPR) repeat protein
VAAANRALAVAANREAVAFLERALGSLVEQKDTPQTLGTMIDVRRILHQALYLVGELQKTRANLAEAERLAERLADPVRLCRVMSSETYLLATIGELADAIEIGERALAMLDHGEDDLEGTVSTRLMLARALYGSGRYRDAIGHIRPVIEMLGEDVPRERLGPGVHQGVNARLWLLLCLAELGEFAEGMALAADAQRLSSQMASPWQHEEQVWLRIATGRSAVLQGDFATAVETLEPALILCEHEFVIHFSRAASSLGVAHARSGRVERGVALLREAVSRAEAISFRFCFGLLLAQLGEALLLADDADGALDAGKRALDAARRSGEEAGEGWALLLLGDVAARCDRTLAAARYREALDIAERLTVAPLRARCLKELGRLS